jgi:hypothetical protein
VVDGVVGVEAMRVGELGVSAVLSEDGGGG